MTGLAVPQSARLRCNTRWPVRGQRPDRLRPCLQARPRRHCLEAQGLCLPFRTLAPLAQDEESGLLGGEEGGGRGLGALTAPASAFSAASPKTSTSRSPAFASSMILLTIISSVRSAGRLTAARAVSKATPMRPAVITHATCRDKVLRSAFGGKADLNLACGHIGLW